VEIVLLVGARPYPLSEQSALELRDLIRERASDDRMLGYLADAISEDLEQSGSPEPIDLGHAQIEALADILFAASPGRGAEAAAPGVPALHAAVGSTPSAENTQAATTRRF
jgi:hypothetical protein